MKFDFDWKPNLSLFKSLNDTTNVQPSVGISQLADSLHLDDHKSVLENIYFSRFHLKIIFKSVFFLQRCNKKLKWADQLEIIDEDSLSSSQVATPVNTNNSLKNDHHELEDHNDVEWHKNSSFDDISSTFNIKKLRRSFSLGDLNELSIKTDCSEELDAVNAFSIQHQMEENQNMHQLAKSSPHTDKFLNLTYDKSNETVSLSMSHFDHDHIKSSSPRTAAQEIYTIEENNQLQVEAMLPEEKVEEENKPVSQNAEPSQNANESTQEPKIEIYNVDFKAINDSIKLVIQNVLFEPKIGKYLRENNNSFLFSSASQDDYERFLNQISILQRYFDVLKQNHSASSLKQETDM